MAYDPMLLRERVTELLTGRIEYFEMDASLREDLRYHANRVVDGGATFVLTPTEHDDEGNPTVVRVSLEEDE